MQFLKTGFSICFVLSTLFIYGQSQGEFHQSDPLGNFQVSYAASGGHYLVEDRTYDGTAHLGNYGYSARDGESVGVAYGTDGAGFVIRGPGAGGGSRSQSSYPSIPSYPRAVAPAPRRSAYRPAPTTYNDGAYYERYQDRSSSTGQWPASGRTQPSSSRSSAISSYSSLPANTPAPASYVSAATPTTYYAAPVQPAAPTTSTYIDPYQYTAPAIRQPFSYAFESYSYQPPVPSVIPAAHPQVTYNPSPSSAAVPTYAPQPSAYSYNQYASPTNIMQYAFNSQQHPTTYSLFRK